MVDKRDNNCVGEECSKNQPEHIMRHMTVHHQDGGPHTMVTSGGARLTWVDCQESCECFKL